MFQLRRPTAALGAVLSLTAAAAIAVVTTAAPATAATAEPKLPGFATTNSASFLTPGQRLSISPVFGALSSVGLPSGQGGVATTLLAYRLVMQSDGNLVEYRDDAGASVAVWATHTTTGSYVIFQTDHNVVLRDAQGRALWATGTAGSTASVFQVYGDGELVTQDASGRVLASVGPAQAARPGVFVAGGTSPLGAYRLDVQADGNIVEYATVSGRQQAVWATRTAGAGPVRFAAQSDGNLVAYQVSTGRAVWASHTRGPAAYYQLDVQDDANVVLYRTDGLHRLQAVWASHTRV